MNFNPEQLYTYKTLFSVRRSQTTPEYPISPYVSGEELYGQLSAILDQEMNIESCDYINIITQRRS